MVIMKKWIQKSIKHPGRVKKYLRRLYGDKAFTKDGKVKLSYIKKAIKHLKRMPESKRAEGLLNALQLAIRLHKIAKRRRRK